MQTTGCARPGDDTHDAPARRAAPVGRRQQAASTTATEGRSAYAHPGYAASLAGFGTPVELPRCGGWLLERPIGGTGLRDAMGCYPLFDCADWSGLAADLDACAERFVSVALVTDPFGACDEALLRRSFQRVAVFKQHYVADLELPVNARAPQRHRYNARRALSRVIVDVPSQPLQCLEEWCDIYGQLAARRRIDGIRRFSRASFAAQFALPGLVVMRAREGTTTVGMHLWLVDGEVARSHLSASSERGYALASSYAIHWAANEYFAGKIRWLHLGGGAGLRCDGSDGLSAFKRGWATGTRPVYFCGRVCDPRRYAALARDAGAEDTGYFPAYRVGEF
jgi:hypothetical protein